MKKKKITAVTAALLLIIAIAVSACGNTFNSSSADSTAAEYVVEDEKGTSGGTYNNYAIAGTYDAAYEEGVSTEDAPEDEDGTEKYAGTEGVDPAESKEKLVYTCWMTIQTLEFAETEKAVKEAVAKVGAIIEAESISDTDYSWYKDNYKRNGTLSSSLTIRVPSAKYNEFIDLLNGAGGKVTSKSQNVENITKRYNDQTIYIQSLEMQEKRLLEMMEQAETVEEMITVEERLTDVQTELNQAKSTLASMDTDVNYSTVNLTLEEVVRYTDSPKTPVSFGERIVNAFADSWDHFISFLQDLLITIIYILPGLVLIALIALVIFLMSRVWRKKHPKIKKEKKPNPNMYDQRPFAGRNGRVFRGPEANAGIRPGRPAPDKMTPPDGRDTGKDMDTNVPTVLQDPGRETSDTKENKTK